MGGESDLAGGVSFQATGATTIAWQRGGRAGRLAGALSAPLLWEGCTG